NVCFLWRDTQSGEGWDATSPFPEFDPYLGFYDEGLRETADWEIKLMAEHGIDFMHVCWYCPTGNQTAPIKKMRVSYGALHDGYMNAIYSDLVDFCIMWENNGQDVTSFEQFKAYIWPYWKEYYFADERYARLDNKAVLTVWNSNNMKTAFGGTAEGVKEAIDFMDAELREMGYDGIIILLSTTGMPGKSTYEAYESYGVDATYGYHWGTSGYDPVHQINCNENNIANSADVLHHIPTVSVGFNDVGRNETRDPIITGTDHLAVCEYLKETVDGFDTGSWKDNTVMISTWNEFSEGTYVMPTASNGFDYLENVRKVFTSDDSDHTENDAPLTVTQLDRVGHLYPPNHSPIRRYQFEDTDESAEESGKLTPENLYAVRTYDMSSTDGTDAWEHGFSIPNYSETDGVIKGTSNRSDFAIYTSALEELYGVDIPVLHIRMKNTQLGAFEVFYTTSTDSTWNYDKHTGVNITKTGEFVDYYVNMASTAKWTNIITAIRIDPNIVQDSFEISLI
ncbi:MAG: glycoside hydrolase family 99-like domain-containing protein, partial [Clostridia bacterium]|nr:glycoside hydrolase family 99-like domain-containing protein [Clostridia bacterium]